MMSIKLCPEINFITADKTLFGVEARCVKNYLLHNN